MPEIETISWKWLTGNKFNKALEPGMDSDAGYVKFRRVRRTGDALSRAFNVVYDREYLIEFIGKSICKPLFVFGKEKVLELVSEAWDNYYESDKSANARMALNK